MASGLLPFWGARHAPYTLRRDVAYGQSPALTADLYVPAGPGLFPGVVAVHGGSWSRRSRRDMAPIARKLTRRGYLVANISYRFAPAHVYPAQLDDVRMAIRWMRAHAAELRLDPDRLGAWGYSAGAHLVALAATDAVAAETALQAVVAGGMPADLTRYPHSPLIRNFIGAAYDAVPAIWTKASPAHQVTPRTPPMFLYHGSGDRLVHAEDARIMKRALDAAGVPAELYLIPRAGHISTYLFGFGAEAAGLRFLDRVLQHRA